MTSDEIRGSGVGIKYIEFTKAIELAEASKYTANEAADAIFRFMKEYEEWSRTSASALNTVAKTEEQVLRLEAVCGMTVEELTNKFLEGYTLERKDESR